MPEARKLIYILNSYSSNDSSHFHHVLGLLEAIAALGVDIALVIEKSNEIPAFRHANIKVFVLKPDKGLARLCELFVVLMRLTRLGYRRTFVRIAAPAAIIAVLVRRLFGGAVYLWQSGTTQEFDNNQPLSMRKCKWMFTSHLPTWVARRWVDHLVTGPMCMIDYYADVAGVKREKIRLLYNDIDLARFKRLGNSEDQKKNFLRSRGIAENALILLVVHRFSPVRKTLLYFPECISKLATSGSPRPVLTIVAGGGPDLPAIQQMTQKYGVSDNCIFFGDIPNREIENLYTIADIFIHPTYNEGFPRVILEAMAAGLPIATTDAGGTTELLGQEQKKFVVSKNKPADFTALVHLLVSDEMLRRQLGEENLINVRQFATEKVAVMYEKVLFS